MNIIVDSFTAIGKRHLVCEDYAISGYSPVPYVILSDGCSSSDESDIGARILVHYAKQFLKYHKDDLDINEAVLYKKMGNFVIHSAEQLIRSLGLKLSCLDATLMVSFFDGKFVKTFCYGDGNIILLDGNEIRRYSVSFANEAPYYLTYWINCDWKKTYFKKFKAVKTLFKRTYYTDDSRQIRYDEIAESASMPTYLSFSVNLWPTILISSDGIDSFKSVKTGEAVSSLPVYRELTAFKNMNGEFIKRRTKRAIKTIENKHDCVHVDDISIGGFHFNESIS